MPKRKEWKGKGEKVSYSLTSWKINEAYYFDGFFPMLIEGQQRIGKSAYASKTLAHAYGKWEYKPYVHCVEPDYEAVKPWMTFMPREYLDAVLHAADHS